MKKDKTLFLTYLTLFFLTILPRQMNAGRLMRKAPKSTEKNHPFVADTKGKIISDYELALTTTNPIAFQREEITLKTNDGLTRYGTLTTRKNAKGNVVLCHPAAYDQDFMIPYEENVFSYYNCIRFDFRRHGKNCKGQSTTIGKREAAEVKAAVDFLKKHPKAKNLPIYGFGVSMGAAALIEAESIYHEFDGLILQSPFESLREQVKRCAPFFRRGILHNLIFREPVRLYAKLRYRIRLSKFYPDQSIKKIRTPIFLMHAHNDPFIDISAFRKLKEAGKHCIIKTWDPQAGGHTEMFKTFPDLYTKKCNEFLDTVARSKNYLTIAIAKASRRLTQSKKHIAQKKQISQRKHRQKYLITSMLQRKRRSRET